MRVDVRERVGLCSVEFSYGGDAHRAGAGSTVFVRAGVVHGAANVGDTGVRYVAIFSQTTVDMEYVERVPAPGTEANPPSRSVWDMRTGILRELH